MHALMLYTKLNLVSFFIRYLFNLLFPFLENKT